MTPDPSNASATCTHLAPGPMSTVVLSEDRTVDEMLLMEIKTPPSVDENPTFGLWPPLLTAKFTPVLFCRMVTISETSSPDVGNTAQAGCKSALAADQ